MLLALGTPLFVVASAARSPSSLTAALLVSFWGRLHGFLPTMNSLVAHAFHPPCSGELKRYLSTILSTSPTYTYGQESPVQTIDHHLSSLHRLEFDLLLADRRSHH